MNYSRILTYTLVCFLAIAAQPVISFAQKSSENISGTRFRCVTNEEKGTSRLFRKRKRLKRRQINSIRKRYDRRITKVERKLDRIEEGTEQEKQERLEDRLDKLESILDALEACVEGNDDNGGNGTTSCPNGFSKQVTVFGLRVCATSQVSDAKALHAASILAEYLDNDEDGTADDPTLIETLQNKKATLVMYQNESEEEDIELPDSIETQNLFAFETITERPLTGEFDAALEEVLHLVSHIGLANAYPEQLGEDAGSTLTEAMDTARGGQFFTIPPSYPDGAWYTYDDESCDYNCMATEYFYWSLTSVLGAQDFGDRFNSISGEWKLNTLEKVQTTDTGVYALISSFQQNGLLPVVIPDGTYLGSTLEIE